MSGHIIHLFFFVHLGRFNRVDFGRKEVNRLDIYLFYNNRTQVVCNSTVVWYPYTNWIQWTPVLIVIIINRVVICYLLLFFDKFFSTMKSLVPIYIDTFSKFQTNKYFGFPFNMKSNIHGWNGNLFCSILYIFILKMYLIFKVILLWKCISIFR